MTGAVRLITDLDRLCREAEELCAGSPAVATAAAIRSRLHGPLRVAIAGRVKAGKSTLLNALVGERLAPTDAGECTRVVSWYQHGMAYEVRALLAAGGARALPFSREDGALEIDLGGLSPADVSRLEISWPSSRLASVTLIDTPGLASLDESTSVRTVNLLTPEEDEAGEADAVIYLMRHMHRLDAEFLESFLDRSVSNASPVNAVAVLSRADEVGVGRLDAMASAATIAGRYARDERLRSLAVTVLPVAGLVAETATTLREDEFGWLRALATMPAEEADLLLLSVDRFSRPDVSPLSAEIRRELLARFGMFGLRFALDRIRSGEVSSGPALSRALLDVSGLHALRSVLEGHFMTRAQSLKARSALGALRTLAREVGGEAPSVRDRLLGSIEEVEARSHELAELRLIHLVLSGSVDLSEDEVAEVNRLTGGKTPAERAGCPEPGDPEIIRRTALEGVERWRSRAGNPLTDRRTSDACEIVARSYEGLFSAADR